MDANNEGNVSPMTRSPLSAAPMAVDTDAVLRGPQSDFRTNSRIANAGHLSPGSGIEARDYMNGGLPHEILNPVPINGHANSLVSKPATLWKNPLSPSSPLADPAGVITPDEPLTHDPKNVQFARGEGGTGSTNHTRNNSFEDETDTAGKDRRTQSIIAKLKALTLSTHQRSHSTGAVGEGAISMPTTPVTTRVGRRAAGNLGEEGSDVDADAEETADDENFVDAMRTRRKRRFRRPQEALTGTNPNSPTAPRETPREGDSPSLGVGHSARFQAMIRRSTMPENEERLGMSEGEGRDHLRRQSAWRRGSALFAGGRGHTYTGGQSALNEDGVDEGVSAPRPNNYRRTTGRGGGVSDGEGTQTPRRPFLNTERATTFGSARWKMLKHGLKMLNPKKDRHEIDYLKSAELMAELRAGAPAALMLASMIQRDEHGNKRIPVLLEQLKLKVTESRATDDKEDGRHLIFCIDLEYGSGSGRMKWSIHRTIGDFANLHVKYKVQASSDKYIQLKSDVSSRPKQPRFPRSAFPYMRTFRGLDKESDEDEPEPVLNDLAEDTAGEATAGEQTHSETDRINARKKRRPSLTNIRRRSTTHGPISDAQAAQSASSQKKAFADKQRKKLEQYLQEMIRWLIFRADSNRLCKFLELSALGVRLSAEGGYHGKEGFMIIQTSKGVDFRRILTPSAVFKRHSPKWFLVRSNYIVCVDSPENMHIYDVFLLDAKFEIEKRRSIKDIGASDAAMTIQDKTLHPQHHRLKLRNGERKLKLLARNDRIIKQFEDSIRHMMETSPWAKPNRFDSFAPVRKNVFAQWLVDGRDYMWNVSRAINEAKDVIYIHDWWLSPQLYMRRPAAISQKWRLDRLLRKKAREGVKVFVIVYRNVEAAIPIDSEFTKFCLLDLHPNIFVQRSPNQFKKNQFFYAHHEKICIVDHSVAFVGGIDLCFGRWDTPQHSVSDDKPTGFEQTDDPKDADHCQLWPGKDYSNPRVQDFYQLSEPYAEMYDRSKTPRMPWHDISMQVVGQPARDLTRHFIQRWNYVLRGRKPTRPTPFLLPPPDCVEKDLEAVGMTGTCEVQILRSASNWSLGVEEVEHSIMNAYCKMIEESEHFVYMENQFFITSCETMNTKIVNKIGDAIVERAIRAYRNNESWRCIIVIPLMPGFQNTVDAADGTSIRLIMQCQFRSISRGEDSIFGRLRAAGIEPEEFITFYSLRAWGRIGPNKALVTEQLYIHAKVIIVDDRIALIGSANINERSMLGSRDSETAAVVRDTDMIWSTMDGEPYLVGRFAHTLRMRLMREHLGLDVDAIMEEERNNELDRVEEDYDANMEGIYKDAPDEPDDIDRGKLLPAQSIPAEALMKLDNNSFNHDIDWEQSENPNVKSDKLFKTSDKRVTGNKEHAAEVDGLGDDQWKAAEDSGIVKGRDSVVLDGVREVLVTSIMPEGKGSIEKPKKPHLKINSGQRYRNENSSVGNISLPPAPALKRKTTEQLGLLQLSQLPALPVVDDTDIGGPPVTSDSAGRIMHPENPLMADLKRANVSRDCMKDPLNDSFFENTWRQIAENNTKIFRRVFRCNPDNEVTNWHEYTEFQAYAERFSQAQMGGKSQERAEQENPGKSGPPGAGLIPTAGVGHTAHAISEKLHHDKNHENGDHPQGTVAEWAEKAEQEAAERNSVKASSGKNQSSVMDEKDALKQEQEQIVESQPPLSPAGVQPFPSFDDSTGNTPDLHVDRPPERHATFSVQNGEKRTRTDAGTSAFNPLATQGSQKRRRRGTTRSKKGFSASDDIISKADAEALLGMVQGSLVVFPYDWLKVEEHNNNWLYQVDMVAPLQIYD